MNIKKRVKYKNKEPLIIKIVKDSPLSMTKEDIYKIELGRLVLVKTEQDSYTGYITEIGERQVKIKSPDGYDKPFCVILEFYEIKCINTIHFPYYEGIEEIEEIEDIND